MEDKTNILAQLLNNKKIVWQFLSQWSHQGAWLAYAWYSTHEAVTLNNVSHRRLSNFLLCYGIISVTRM